MTGKKQLIVTEASAEFFGFSDGIRQSNHIPSPANHRDLVRFESSYDQRYRDLIEELKTMALEASINSPMADQSVKSSTTAGGKAKMLHNDLARAASQRSQSPAWFRVHLPMNFAQKHGSFVERTGLLGDMRREIFSSTSSKRILALYGAPGSGKTQLSNHYVREYWADYSAYFKFDLGSTERFNRSLKEIYSQVHSAKGYRIIRDNLKGSEEALLAAVMEWFSKANNKSWISVIDQIDSNTLQSRGELLKRLVLEVPHGTFVLISQSTLITRAFEGSSSLRVPGLSDAESTKLFKQSLGSGFFNKSKGEDVLSAPNRCQTDLLDQTSGALYGISLDTTRKRQTAQQTTSSNISCLARNTSGCGKRETGQSSTTATPRKTGNHSSRPWNQHLNASATRQRSCFASVLISMRFPYRLACFVIMLSLIPIL